MKIGDKEFWAFWEASSKQLDRKKARKLLSSLMNLAQMPGDLSGDLSENQQLLSRFAEDLPPHHRFWKELAAVVSLAFPKEDLSQSGSLEKKVHQFRYVISSQQAQYVREHYEGDNASLEKIVDDYNAQIIGAIMPEVFPRLMRVFADNVLNGMVTTVAKKTPVLVWYSVVVYILYIVLLITHVKRNGLDGRAILAVYTLLAVMINVAVVSATIFCQTRYMIYNMPLFYISLILLCGSFSTKPAVCAGSKGMV